MSTLAGGWGQGGCPRSAVLVGERGTARPRGVARSRGRGLHAGTVAHDAWRVGKRTQNGRDVQMWMWLSPPFVPSPEWVRLAGLLWRMGRRSRLGSCESAVRVAIQGYSLPTHLVALLLKTSCACSTGEPCCMLSPRAVPARGSAGAAAAGKGEVHARWETHPPALRGAAAATTRAVAALENR